MEPTPIHTLSALLEQSIHPDPDVSLESAADARLARRLHAEALSGYYQLDVSIPRIATKIAFCEWVMGHDTEAQNRLVALDDNIEADGIGLLCELIRTGTDYKRRMAEMAAIWPRLQAVTTSDSVPLLAAIARSQAWWPGDTENREQRHRDLERLLSLHPGSQLIRLAVLAAKQYAHASADEQYALLNAVQYRSLIPRYLWEAASVAAGVGKHDEALGYLNQLEAHERSSETASRQLALNIDLARCDIAVKANAPDSFSGFDRLLGDASLDSDDRRRVIRAALAAACSVAPERVPALASDFLTALETDEFGFGISSAELYNDAYPVEGTGWDSYGHTWACGDLMPCREFLVDVAQDRARLFFRAAFAVVEIDAQYDADEANPDIPTEFWDGVASLLGDVAGHEGEFGGRLASLDTAIRANRHRPNWTTIGQDWIASEWVANQNGQDSTHGWLTLQAATRNEASTRIFAAAVIKRLCDYTVPAPVAYDLVSTLADALVTHKLSADLYQLMRSVSESDERPGVQFYLGLAAQRTNRAAEARSAYLRVLAEEPDYHSAIFNSLLLCEKPADTPFLAQIEPLVAQYPADEPEKKNEISDELAKARQRCEDKDVVKRRVIREALSTYPALVKEAIEPGDISLRAAVALLALFRCANAEPGGHEIPPFDGCGIPFAPAVGGRRILFDLLQTGLVAVDPKTSIAAFTVEDGELQSWRLGSIRWRVSPAAGVLVEQLRFSNCDVPDSWRRDVQSLALEIARGEIVEYLNFLAQERGWPEPRDTEEIADLTRALVNELPVAQALHLAYLGAMSASDYKQKYPVSGQQAADMLVKRTGQRLESVRDGRFPAKAYDRPWKLPRSAVSFALWNTILNMGDDGFTHRIADVTASP